MPEAAPVTMMVWLEFIYAASRFSDFGFWITAVQNPKMSPWTKKNV
jgi:hypothetical protein